MQTVQRMPETREQAIAIFKAWINQRPGLDARNYISDYRDENGRRAYREEQVSIRKERTRALEALQTFEGLPYDPEMLKAAMSHGFSGRLQFNESGTLDYCTGQYWPTEYRPAAAACLEQYVSDMRQKGIGIPPGAQKQHGQAITVEQLMQINAGHGGHFFESSNMSYFKSRVPGPIFAGRDGWYFVTSERRDDDERRRYSVRRMNSEGTIDHPEPEGFEAFQKYTTEAESQKVARQLAEQSREG